MTEWWERFFSGAWSRIQAGGYPAERTAAECDLIESALELPPEARVLDIPCGIGRHSIELARRGFRVTGVDFSAESVTLARESAAAAGVDVDFIVGDMRQFVHDVPFDAAFCFFGSFGYFTEDDDRRFVRAVERALRPGGRFLIESHIAETLLPQFRERDWFWAGTEAGRVRVLEERSWDIETGRMNAVWTLVDDSGSNVYSSSIRIYTYRELRALLESEGFVRVEARDGKTGQSFRIGSQRALVIAEKSHA